MTVTMGVLILAIGSEALQPQRPHDSSARPATAVVPIVSGDVSVVEPGRPRRAVGRFDWLPEGAVVSVGPESGVTLAFATGRRYALGPGASARLVPGGLTNSVGDVTTLPSVPPLPRLQLAPPPRGDRAMAVRIRGPRSTRIYPADEASVLADEAVLRFLPVSGAQSYRVDVEDLSGASVFRIETQSTTVSISRGILKAGAQYQWSVRCLAAAGAPAGAGSRTEADFSTLSEENTRARARLREALTGSDAATLGLLAEIDRGLGLRWEAREGFRRALERSPDDPGLGAAFAAVGDPLAVPEPEN